ncbi:hypothetical protein ACFO4N_15960 [Camelliibacillus cellulosilyticus]|uniref:t-SNARE coiled-coil homology domain-containing protein n=1 Tax=Camelliibacillus cellulosilyticus TaxID=2174486 RepID=A0ABV9GTH8_9BACL
MAEDLLKEMKTMIEELTKQVGGINDRLDHHETLFEGINDRLDHHETLFEGVNDRLDHHETLFEGINDRLDRHEAMLEQLIEIVGATNKMSSETHNELKSFKSDVYKRFDHLERKIDMNAIDIHYIHQKVSEHDLILNRHEQTLQTT